MQAYNFQAVIKIRPESVCLNQRLQILVGGCDTPEIHVEGLRAPDPYNLFLLQHAHQIGLGFQADVADLIQEYRAAISHLELALLAELRARKRTAFMAKQFAFEQGLRQRPAVDGHQGH